VNRSERTAARAARRVDVEPVQTGAAAADAYLTVKDLRVHFPTDDGLVKAVDGLSFTLQKGKTVGIVGESGSGKSVTSQAILGLHRRTRARATGEIWLDGENLMEVSNERLRDLRGDKMAMIFQDPLSALHPYYTVGAQIVEAVRTHRSDIKKAAARKRALEMLDLVGIPNPAKRIDQYPHEFSGGMRQRAMIAMALVNDPPLLIADEPTTALDVTVQAQILDLMRTLQKEFGAAIIMITHDLGVVAEMADDVLVMYAGRVVEQGPVDSLFAAPEDPYTWGLLSSMPRLDRTRQTRLTPVPGNPPSLINPPSGCKFHPRCRFTSEVPGDRCRTEEPELIPTLAGSVARCHIAPARRAELYQTVIKPSLQPEEYV
jgi:peptide/nickel transport system ATP-binding protein